MWAAYTQSINSELFTFTVQRNGRTVFQQQGYPSHTDESTFNCLNQLCTGSRLQFPHSKPVPSGGVIWACPVCRNTYKIKLRYPAGVTPATLSINASLATLQKEVQESRSENKQIMKKVKELVEIVNNNYTTTQAALLSIQNTQLLLQASAQTQGFQTPVSQALALQHSLNTAQPWSPISATSDRAGDPNVVVINNFSVPMTKDRSNQSNRSTNSGRRSSGNINHLYPFRNQ